MSLVPGRRREMAIFVLAAFVRLVHLLHVAPTPVFAWHRDFVESDMYMFDQWSQRIAAGDVLGRAPYQPLNGWQLELAPEPRWREWYGNPLAFYKAPLYPYLVAVLRKLFGEPMLPLSLLQIVASALSAVALCRITDRLFSPAAGFAAAVAFALYAPAIHYDTVMLRGPLIVLVSLAATLRLFAFRDTPSVSHGLITGLLVGIALLLNEGFLSVPPLVLCLLVAWSPRGLRLRAAAAFVAGMVLALVPLGARNVAVGIPPTTLAVTGSTVFAVFNSADSDPHFFSIRPDTLTPIITAGGGRLAATALACLHSFSGPAAFLRFYLQKSSGLVIPFENPDNANFYYVALKDPVLGLLPGYGALFAAAAVGLVLARRRLRDSLPLAPFALSLLASILMTMTLSRYRVTLAVYLFPFAGLALAKAADWLRGRRYQRMVAAVVAAAILALGARSLEAHVLPGPRGLYLYRPPEFVLGAAFYARRGQYKPAVAELFELVRRNPDANVRAVALATAAGYQARMGDRAGALESLALAVSASPQNAPLLMAAGDQHAALDDGPGAADLYRRALELRPPESLAAQLRDRLTRVAGPNPME